MSNKQITGAEIFLECLKKEKVDTLFCYPGGVVLKIFDVLYDQKDIRIILPRHEQGGVHMADGYARSTGRVCVALVTSGPGATNVVTALATAYMDSIPIVVFTGQVPTAVMGCDAFQEADVYGITAPVTKHNYLVKRVEDIPRVVAEAFHIASIGIDLLLGAVCYGASQVAVLSTGREAEAYAEPLGDGRARAVFALWPSVDVRSVKIQGKLGLPLAELKRALVVRVAERLAGEVSGVKQVISQLGISTPPAATSTPPPRTITAQNNPPPRAI